LNVERAAWQKQLDEQQLAARAVDERLQALAEEHCKEAEALRDHRDAALAQIESAARDRESLEARITERDAALQAAQRQFQYDLEHLTEALCVSQAEASSAQVAHQTKETLRLQAELEQIERAFESERTDHQRAILALESCLSAERSEWQEQVA